MPSAYSALLGRVPIQPLTQSAAGSPIDALAWAVGDGDGLGDGLGVIVGTGVGDGVDAGVGVDSTVGLGVGWLVGVGGSVGGKVVIATGSS